jgi:hypothetical protein
MEGAISKTNLSSRTVPRVELDHRSREARLRFERLARLFILRVTATHFRLRKLLRFFRLGRYGGLPQEGSDKKLLNDRGPSRLPIILGLLLENTEVYNSSGVFNF